MNRIRIEEALGRAVIFGPDETHQHLSTILLAVPAAEMDREHILNDP